jgi:hypothetical protein
MQRKARSAARAARLGKPRNVAMRLKSRWLDGVDVIDFRMFPHPFRWMLLRPAKMALPTTRCAAACRIVATRSMRRTPAAARIEPNADIRVTRIALVEPVRGDHRIATPRGSVRTCALRGALNAFPSHLEEKS